ncbi:replication-relaxation family protein [Dactylosporangium sp. CA-152071]|uniref:replication-relaxation family protein n=1 Tax=Dactylosporangium sp. CA-152071 TaxID=3239933 RepID=UPI003D8B0C56
MSPNRPDPNRFSPAGPPSNSLSKAKPRVPPPSARPDPLAVYRRITARDRALLSLLAEHYLLSAPQIASAFFDGLRTAQRRLTILHRLDILHRFALANPANTAVPYLYALGPVGLQMFPTVYHNPDPTQAQPRAPRTSLERARRIAASRKAAHLIGANQFFIDLITTSRHQPGTELRRWWSEQHATDVYTLADIRPDGHGIWHAEHRTAGFFLEHDNSTENLARVIAKLRGYERLAAFGPRYPVLLWVPSRDRETNLLHLLAGLDTAMPIATAVHSHDPAGPVWTLTADPGHRRRLHELPSDHGPHAATNPSRYPDDD